MAIYHCGMNDTHRDTVDCLLSELKDAYEALGEDQFDRLTPDGMSGQAERARISIERAFQLVSDLKAAQS